MANVERSKTSEFGPFNNSITRFGGRDELRDNVEDAFVQLFTDAAHLR